MYIYGVMDKLLEYQDKVLKLLAGKMEDFYLAGGTALSRVYFKHRISYDLDFFTKKFSKNKISMIMQEISKSLGLRISLAKEQNKKDMAKMAVYYIYISKGEILKIDFVEDFFELIEPLKTVDGIKVLSLEDIYLRKIFTVSGAIGTTDLTGRRTFKGGREEPKDFYDLYVLSHTFMRLSEFARRYCDSTRKEGLITWFRSYDRMEMKTGLLDIITDNRIDYKNMERHFNEEIDRLVKKEIGLL
ncbi:nucleotidyl transferase AbiEii/AbiGii toxin family protein [bacterium]|jgi:predicted nucleotidyltransferase|nr:nucleotidyl transferase AbiEii/AbiGii toxin family protein [bacterium]